MPVCMSEHIASLYIGGYC